MKKLIVLALAALFFSPSAFAQFQKNRMYEVTVTNITGGQYFTPILAVTHKPDIALFDLGVPASEELELLAENGMTKPLEDAVLAAGDSVVDTATSEGLLGPGETTKIMIEGRTLRVLSLAAMLLPTNDSFIGLNSMILPRSIGETTARAYDAGTEANDELCVSIPGPQCMGENVNDDSGEGFVHVSPGTHGEGDLSAAAYDWRNPVALVSVRRVR